MKDIIISLLITAAIIFGGVHVFVHTHKVTYTVNAVCKEKFPQYRETSSHNYVVIFEYDNGRIEEKSCDVKDYTRYKLNTKYTFTKYKYVWK